MNAAPTEDKEHHVRTPQVLHLDAGETVAAIARLLNEATRLAFRRADHEGPTSPWYGLALAIFVAATEATAFLPVDVDPIEPIPPQDDITQLLAAADDLAIDLPVDGTLPGVSELIVTLADLRREIGR